MQDLTLPSNAAGPRAARAALALTAVAALSGCAAAFAPAAPQIDARLGDATRQAMAQQVLRPEADAAATEVPAGFDGVAALQLLARHREGFKNPPATFGALGIGSGTGQP